MKILGIYNIIVLIITLLMCLEDMLLGIDVAENLWGIALFVPVLFYVIKTLQDQSKN